MLRQEGGGVNIVFKPMGLFVVGIDVAHCETGRLVDLVPAM